MLCKAEERDPRKCLKYGKEVSACASKFFHLVRDNCAETFTDYWQCLDHAPNGTLSYNKYKFNIYDD
jgi:NADH dehydrogenase (ubiquinone) 1 alpha subcomplex subunit 8